MTKLTIVANCTDRKSVRPHPLLRVGSIPTRDSGARFAVWRQRVEESPQRVPLHDLYQGEAWQQVRGLTNDARAAGYDVETLVASAGLGLRDVTTAACSYAATFSGGHEDTVASGATESRQWWKRLGALSGSKSLADDAHDRVLLVLSESYARSMDEDLVRLANRGGDLLLVGGARDVDGVPRLPANRSLRSALGGTVSSVSIRMARRWMQRRTGTDLYCSGDAESWSQWAATAQQFEQFNRTPMTDGQMVNLIDELLISDPHLSASRALRLVRDGGIACEQKRFGAIFRTRADAL